MNAIAVEVGYGDPVSFRRLFRRLVHDTPTAYRRRQRMPDAVRQLGMSALVLVRSGRCNPMTTRDRKPPKSDRGAAM